MQDQNRHFLGWIKTKLMKEYAFIEGPEHHRAEKEFSALTSDDSKELNKWIEKYLTDKQIKSMKAAYRKSKSRHKNNFLTRTTDSIELDYAHSAQLKDLAQYNNVNKREYIKRLIDTEHKAMQVKLSKDRKDALLEAFNIVDDSEGILDKLFKVFHKANELEFEVLHWLKTENKQLENYSPQSFLKAKKNGEKQVLALLDSMQKDFDIVT